MPEHFVVAVKMAQNLEDNVVMLRKWKDYGVRYGELDAIGTEVMEELVAAYPQERLNQLVEIGQKSTDKTSAPIKREKVKLTAEMLEDESWEKRYQALVQMEDPTVEDLPLLNQALADTKVSIRRQTVVYLGMIEDPIVLPYLYKGLTDKNSGVRRTAGDCLSI